MAAPQPPAPPRVLGPQRAVLRLRGVRPLIVASLVGRLPIGMTPLAVILLLRAEGRSYALAGLVDGAVVLGVAIAQPALGRMIDRLGLRRVLVPSALAFALAVVALATAGSRGAAAYALIPLALLAGMSLPPVGASLRALWPALVTAPELRGAAYTLDAILQEVTFIVGPPLAAVLAAAASPRVALSVVALLALVGAAAFSRLAAREPARERRKGARALDSVGARLVLSLSLLLGASFGAEEIAMPAFAEHHGARAAAGVLLAALALGSLLGGVVFGTRTTERTAVRRLGRGLLLCGLAVLPLLAAPSIAAMAVLMLLAGLPIAPSFAAQYLLLDALAVPGAATETFAWNTTAIFAGAAVGNALGGALVAASSYRASLAVAMAFALLSAAIAFALARRGSFAVALAGRP
jgi:MFS family permease